MARQGRTGGRDRSKTLAPLTVSACGAIAVAAAAAVWMQGAPAPNGVHGAALDGPAQGTSVPWQASGDACANSEARSAAEQALQSDTEGPHNAQLATPDGLTRLDIVAVKEW